MKYKYVDEDMFNVTTFLDNHMKDVPQKTALIHPSSKRTYTYSDLYTFVTGLCSGLHKLGIKKGDRVVIYLNSSPEYLISIFAIWRLGAIAVPGNIVWKEEELQYSIVDSMASAVITSIDSSDMLEKIKRNTPTLSHLIFVGDNSDKGFDRIIHSGEKYGPVPCSPEDICQIQYTSGTTGSPKGAMLTHIGWMAALDAERDALTLTPDDIYLGIYPMAHVGISWGISVLKTEATYVIMERYNLDLYIDYIQKYQITVLAGMPPVIHTLADMPAGTEEKFKSVRRIISGGGPMHSPTWKKFHQRYGISIANAYGLSETIVIGAGTVIRPSHYPTVDEYNSVGTPVGYSEVKVVDENEPSKTLADGEVGEIALRGIAVAKGYWNKPKATSEVFLPDGWFLTGDIGYIDNQGMLVITDRKKDMIIMSGWKIYPTEVENFLIHHPKIKDIAIFGYPDEEKGEIPVAAVIPEPGTGVLTLDELTNYARDLMAGYKVPRRLEIIDVLPRVGGWKLLRRELREKFS